MIDSPSKRSNLKRRKCFNIKYPAGIVKVYITKRRVENLTPDYLNTGKIMKQPGVSTRFFVSLSASAIHKSSITDHVLQLNHLTGKTSKSWLYTWK